MGTAGAWWDSTVFTGVRRRKLCHLSFGHCKASPDGPRIIRWFGLAQPRFAVRSQELVVVFVSEPVFQTLQVLFFFAQNRETSILIKRHNDAEMKMVILFK